MNMIQFSPFIASIATSFRPQQGLTIMNFLMVDYADIEKGKFPSPAGVNYYESFPSEIAKELVKKQFPSPAGVNYYESNWGKNDGTQHTNTCFRPQQGLTIMNCLKMAHGLQNLIYSFRPQQGLTIMNFAKFIVKFMKFFVSVPSRG